MPNLFELTNIPSITRDESFEQQLNHLQSLIKQLSDDFFTQQTTSNTSIDWRLFNEWLIQPENTNNQNPNSRIQNFSNIAIQFIRTSSNVINLIVPGFNFPILCNTALSCIEELRNVLSTSRNALAIFITGVEFSRISQDLYYYRRNQRTPYYDYARNGTEFMNVSWRDYGNRLFSLFRNVRSLTLEKLIATIIKLSNKRIRSTHSRVESYWKVAVAAADYAYCKRNRRYGDEFEPIYVNRPEELSVQINERCQFHFDRGLKGAIMEIPEDSSVVLAFTGTDLWDTTTPNQIITDIVQILGSADSTYYAAVGIAKELWSQFNNRHIFITGHSLGGGLTQFATAALMKPNIQGIGFNSAGLSDGTMKILKRHQKKQEEQNMGHRSNIHIQHIVMQNDWVCRVGTLVGNMFVYASNLRFLDAHKLKEINKAITNNHPTYIYINH